MYTLESLGKIRSFLTEERSIREIMEEFEWTYVQAWHTLDAAVKDNMLFVRRGPTKPWANIYSLVSTEALLDCPCCKRPLLEGTPT